MLSDIAGDLRGADNLAVVVPERRDGQRYVHDRSVLAPACRLEVIYALAPLQTFKNLLLFIVPLWGHNDKNGFPDCLLGRIAVKALRPVIPARNTPVQILTNNGVIRGIHDGAEQKPRLFGLPALGDVPRNAELDDRAVRAAQWHRMRLHAAALALQADDVELKRGLLPGANALIEGTVAFAVLRRYEIVDASAGHLIRGRGPDHLQPGPVHQQERAISGGQLDTLGRGLDDGPEALLALPQYILGALAVGNIDQHIDGARQASLFIEKRCRIRRECTASSVRPLGHSFAA